MLSNSISSLIHLFTGVHSHKIPLQTKVGVCWPQREFMLDDVVAIFELLGKALKIVVYFLGLSEYNNILTFLVLL